MKIFRFSIKPAFYFLFLIGIGKLHSVETISQVRILSAESATLIKEPDSHSYVQRALKKEDLNGHPHIPGSAFFELLNFLDPTRWFDREITEDAYDVLLENVSILEGENTKRKLNFVLVRHVTRGEKKPEWSWDQGYEGFSNLKTFIIDRPAIVSQNFKNPFRVTLWYSNTPVPLSKLSKDRKDKNRFVFVGHIHIDPETSDALEKLSVRHLNFGRFGVFFGVNFLEGILSYSNPICSSNSHEK
ncbi:hypothetical protein JWG45_07190 [Leptospira sp. 201903070]|uniref:Uncharacterized protein n=1 Tax=Leptospira ainlahdjerensis TaxID=2810033 RepID=A0ABS2UDD7_9LEPT|nr:hypothetical protein [Leptospira ainlahdjerensis]MBM9576935.1 hypothetical protein [Leptospira ainlahdjerensis]